MTRKILICGFPHCGTSILKSIIGHIDEVHEIYNETDKVNIKINNKFIICKTPCTHERYFGEKYDDYIKIFIIRNPLFTFSSLNKRFNYNIPDNHSIDIYINTIQQFKKYRNDNRKDVYTIKYEDLFDNNYQELKNILDDIGINYTDDIFDNSNYKNCISEGTKISNIQPKNNQHLSYRTWQINRPFVSNNDISKLDLSETQKQKIISNQDIMDIYPDLKV